jgi:translocation and assembly module TamB
LLAADGTQSHLKLDIQRTDGPVAHLAADLGFALDRFSVDGQIVAEESSHGGVIAALIGRPDLDRVSLKLTARGDRTEGKADLAVAAGDAVNSTGTAQWHRDGAETSMSLDVSAVAPGLPDSPIARLLRQPATLTATATLDDAGVLAVKNATFAIGPAKLSATARYDTKADTLDATTQVDTVDAGPLADLAGGVTWRALHVEATTALSGLQKKPQGTVTIKGSADDVVATSLGDKAPPPGRIDLAGVVRVQPDGRIAIESFDMASPLVALKGTADYLPSTEAAAGKVAIDLKDFAPLSPLAGMAISGHGHIDLAVTKKSDGGRIEWTGTLDDLALPQLPPGLRRQTMTLSGGVSASRNKSWTLEDIRLATDGLSLRISGQGREHTGAIDLSLDLPKLGMLQSNVTGAASVKGKVTLNPQGGNLHVTADLSDLNRNGITAHKLDLVIDTSLQGQAVQGKVTADGDLANQRLSLDGSFVRTADGGLQVPSLQGSWASASVDVKTLAVTPKGATGSGHIKMANLADLAPLVGSDLAGAIDLDIATEPDPAGKITLALSGKKLRVATAGIGTLKLHATLGDPMGAATTDATLEADGLSGVADLQRVAATVKGDIKGFDATLKVVGAATNATLIARIEPTGDEIRIALSHFDARYQGVPVALNAPAHLAVIGSRVKIEPASLRLGGGRVGVSGVVDQTASDLTIDIASLPLSLVEAFAPGANLDGALQGKIHVTGALANPAVQATYALSGARLKQPQTALLPALALRGTAAMANRQASFEATLSAGGSTNITIKGKATIPQGNAPLNATVALSGSMDLAPFAPVAGDSVRNVTGTLTPNLSITVNGKAITGSGTISLANAAFVLPASGLQLTGGTASIALQGNVLQLQSLTFKTARSGTLSASGTVQLDPATGFPTDLSVTTKQALVANRPDMIAAVSSTLKIAGSTDKGFDVTGPITIDRADIAIGASQAASYPTIAVTEINRVGAPPPAPTPPAPLGKQPPKPPELVRLALQISAPQAVFIRGRGLDAEVGGSFTVSGNPSAPAVLGTLTLRRGTFNLLGHELNFTRGNVSLANVNTIDPDLDFAATTDVDSTTIEVDITGTAKAPKIAITSSPALPQDEAMAMLLFGKPSSSLSPFELLSAAQALADLTGGTPAGGGFFGRLRSSLGLDQLSVNSSSSDGSSSSSPSLQGGRYVAPGVYVGAQQGASGDSSQGIVEIEVFKHTKITGAIGADSNDKVGAKMEWDY